MRHLSLTLLALFFLSYSSTRLITHESDAPFIYYYSQADNAFVIERADGADRHMVGKGLIHLNDSLPALHWSPGGKWLLWSQDWNGTSREFAMRYDGQMLIEMPSGGVRWSPTDDYYLYSPDLYSRIPHLEYDTYLIDMDTQQTLRTFHVMGGVGWSPDGRLFSYIGETYGEFVTETWDGSTTSRYIYRPDAPSAISIAWDKAGLLYLHPERHTLILENVERGTLVEFAPPIQPFGRIAWSPDQQYALIYIVLEKEAATEEVNCCQIWLLSLQSPTLRLLTDKSSIPSDGYWSPDGAWADYQATANNWERIYIDSYRIEQRNGPDDPYGPYQVLSQHDYQVSPAGRYAASINPCELNGISIGYKCIIHLSTAEVASFPGHHFFTDSGVFVQMGRVYWQAETEWVLFYEYYPTTSVANLQPLVSVANFDGFYRDLPPCPDGACPQWLPPNVPIQD